MKLASSFVLVFALVLPGRVLASAPSYQEDAAAEDVDDGEADEEVPGAPRRRAPEEEGERTGVRARMLDGARAHRLELAAQAVYSALMLPAGIGLYGVFGVGASAALVVAGFVAWFAVVEPTRPDCSRGSTTSQQECRDQTSTTTCCLAGLFLCGPLFMSPVVFALAGLASVPLSLVADAAAWVGLATWFSRLREPRAVAIGLLTELIVPVSLAVAALLAVGVGALLAGGYLAVEAAGTLLQPATVDPGVTAADALLGALAFVPVTAVATLVVLPVAVLFGLVTGLVARMTVQAAARTLITPSAE